VPRGNASVDAVGGVLWLRVARREPVGVRYFLHLGKCKYEFFKNNGGVESWSSRKLEGTRDFLVFGAC